MSDGPTSPIDLYSRFVLSKAGIVVVILCIIFTCLGYQIKNFRLDASSDSLILEHDQDLKLSREINTRYGTSDYVLVTYTPRDDLFSDGTLKTLQRLRDELKKLKNVSSVVSIIDVPLLKNPPVPLKKLSGNIKTLLSKDVDTKLARKEFKESDLYRDLIISPDLKSTAIQVTFNPDAALNKLLKRRTALLDKQYGNELSSDEHIELSEVKMLYKSAMERINKQRHQDILLIREIMDKYRDSAQLFLGGMPMIIDDMISFIKSDLKKFGIGMLCFLIIILSIIFGRIRWVGLALLCCIFSIISMTGIIGIFRWNVTVISSNFISLQLIMTMSLAIHLIVRHNELLLINPEISKKDLVRETVRTKFIPCLYTTLTTIAGFCSLVVCDILPIINFGWMMTAGLIVSLIVTFLLFPALLMLLPKAKPAKKRISFPLPSYLANFSGSHGKFILTATAFVIIVTAFGMSKLEVENSFIDYFKKSTEIYQGMKMIDQELGGTTPLDVILDFKDIKESVPPAIESEENVSDEFDEFEEFDETEDDTKYWYTLEKLDLIERIHDVLDSYREIGKVLSLGTVSKVARDLNNGESFDNLGLALLFNELPEDFKDIIVKPYVSIENNQARISMRIKDSLSSLRRNKLLKEINLSLIEKTGLDSDQIRLSGVMVLYNNMLQSLFRSQIQTIGVTVFALMTMFFILFRSLKISLIAIFPNLLSSLVILGVMGLLDIPLDMMTITIVAICIGIAVDNTIHYLHRFREEIKSDHSYMNTMFRCHKTIGNAMYYTSITIIIGFSILSLSNFIPSVLFGLLTGLAMGIALIAALTLLPRLIILLKPFGPEK